MENEINLNENEKISIEIQDKKGNWYCAYSVYFNDGWRGLRLIKEIKP